MADNDSVVTTSAAAATTDCMIIHSIFDDANFFAINQTTNSSSALNASFLSSPSSSAFDWLIVKITFFINPVFCAFGVLGNVMTIIIMCRNRMKAAMSCRIERASRAGLIGLAVADLFCCTAALAITYGRGMSLGKRSVLYSEHERLRVLTAVYGPFLQNACVKSNTWLTVVVAVGRYMVICRPLQARYLVSVTATRLAIIAAFIVAMLIELPTLWTSTVIPLVCPTTDGQETMRYFVVDHGQLILDSRLKMTYDVVSILMGFIVPVGILVFCNFRLVSSLRQSYQMARIHRVSTLGRVSRGVAMKSSAQSAETRLTLTLVCIVAMFLLLVTPSELVNLYFYAARPTDAQLLEAAIIITNALQTANFSFNFVLYLAVNAQFRGAVAEACLCSAGKGTCCPHQPATTAAITLETAIPTPVLRPSPAFTSTAAGNVDISGCRNEFL